MADVENVLRRLADNVRELRTTAILGDPEEYEPGSSLGRHIAELDEILDEADAVLA